MPLINLKKFWKKTALGRTLSGRNKTGQAVSSIVNPILIATGLKGTTDALGTLTGADDAKEIAEAKGKPVDQLNLNLTPQQERYIRLGLTALLVILSLLGVSLADLAEAINKALSIVAQIF